MGQVNLDICGIFELSNVGFPKNFEEDSMYAFDDGVKGDCEA